jgi:hypothetical protein
MPSSLLARARRCADVAHRGAVAVERHAPTVFSVGRPNLVTLELRSTLPRRVTVELVDDLFDHAESDGAARAHRARTSTLARRRATT